MDMSAVRSEDPLLRVKLEKHKEDSTTISIEVQHKLKLMMEARQSKGCQGCEVEWGLYIPKRSKVLPLPNFPHTSDSSPTGNVIDKSNSMNFVLGVGATEGVRLCPLDPPRALS